jgi:DNA-binding response OmpR family regulator
MKSSWRSLGALAPGWGQEEDRRRSSEAGFDHHLVKPVDLEVLEAVLHSSLEPEGDVTRQRA